MKIFFGCIVGVYIFLSTVVLGLFLSGRLVVVSQRVMVNVVSEAGQTLFQMPTNRTVYMIEFVNKKGEIK